MAHYSKRMFACSQAKMTLNGMWIVTEKTGLPDTKETRNKRDITRKYSAR